jgi:hypothetical protein
LTYQPPAFRIEIYFISINIQGNGRLVLSRKEIQLAKKEMGNEKGYLGMNSLGLLSSLS